MDLRNRSLWIVIVLAFFAGWQASQWRSQHLHTVHAQSSAPALYQMNNLSGQNALTLYYPDSQTIYVYPSVAVGNSFLGCAFSFKLGKPGEPIHREPCPIATMP